MTKVKLLETFTVHPNASTADVITSFTKAAETLQDVADHTNLEINWETLSVETDGSEEMRYSGNVITSFVFIEVTGQVKGEE